MRDFRPVGFLVVMDDGWTVSPLEMEPMHFLSQFCGCLFEFVFGVCWLNFGVAGECNPKED